MVDLSTTYLGLKLKNPLVPSSSPLMQKVDNIRQMEDAGAAAVVLHSLFEEQIIRESQMLDQHLNYGAHSFAEAITYFPDLHDYNLGPEGYLEYIRKVKEAVDIPVIASLNGVSLGGWIRYARKIEEAGADALELNMYYIAADPTQGSDEVEQMYLDLAYEIKRAVKIPVTIKLGHYFTAFAHMARRFAEAGVDGLVLFNRFYQPDFDLEELEVAPVIHLSRSPELLVRLRWVALLFGRISLDLAITGGVHSAEDVLKSMMAGAKVAMTTSALLEYGIDHLTAMLAGVKRWMEEHDYESIRQMQGSMSYRATRNPAAFERANYMRVLRSYDLKTA